MKQYAKKCLSLLLAVMMLALSCIAALPAVADDGLHPGDSSGSRFVIMKEPKKVINIVYDDSGSMVNPEMGDPDNGFTPNWCQAKYALEAFIAILNPDDLLNIYTMDGEGKAYGSTIKGSDKENAVKKIHSDFKTGDSSLGTPIATLDGAAKGLNDKSYNDYERWLIVITDGAFTTDRKGDSEYGNDKVESKLAQYGSDLGGQLIYMPLGLKDEAFKDKHFTTLASSNGTELIDQLQKASEVIYKNRKGDTQTSSSFTINVPTNRIIIFAQGKDVEVESISAPKGKCTSQVEVKYTEKENAVDFGKKGAENGRSFRGKEGKIKDDSSLKGIVATIEPTEDAIRAGEIKVNFVNGAPKEGFRVYYEPAVVAYFSLSGKREDGQTVQIFSSEKEIGIGSISPGEYTLKAYIGDPFDLQKDDNIGEEIPADVSDKAEIQGTSFDVTLSGDAVGGTKTYSLDELRYGVPIALGKGKISCDEAVAKILDKYELDTSGLAGSFEGIVVKATYRLKVDYKLPKDPCLNFKFKRVEYLLPSLKNITKDKYKIKALVSCIDDSGNTRDITPEEWSKLDENNIQIESGPKTNLGGYKIEVHDIENGKGVIYLTPKYANDKDGNESPKKTTHSNFLHRNRKCELITELFIDIDEELAMSTTMSPTEEKSTLYEISISMWFTIVSLFVLIWLLGYFLKRKLPKNKVGKCVNTVAKKEMLDPITFEKIHANDRKKSNSSKILRVTPLTRLIPYVTQRGTLDLGNGIPGLKFKAAAKRGQVYLTNQPSEFEALSKSAKIDKNSRYVQIGGNLLTPDYVKEKQKSKSGFMFTLANAVIEFGGSEGSTKFKRYDLSFKDPKKSRGKKKKK